ncbi:uncharacterized protein LOC143334418 isoform X1 [Chaetodon auriga]|uniref:uncharacterized protein LOC143334418 isoform X1 n=1 Tax=Chaetodon auriga TaxID=39042 RepID=UPI004032F94C
MGFLDVEKLSRGEDCIRCDDRWFSPTAFEDFGGKGSSKKWKASIFYENEPLQFWFEQGHLTTKGYKRKGSETTKQKKVQSSNHTSESSSEESERQSAEDTQEDDVADDDWLPGSEELGLEPEEERVGPENGREVVNSGVEQSKKAGKREMEDEDTPSVTDSRVFEEREAKLRSPTRERSVFQKEVKVVIKRLPEAKSDCQSNYMEHPLGGGRCEPLDKHALNGEDREHSPAIDDAANTHTDCSQMSDPPITQSNERKVDGQKDVGTQTGKSPTPLSGPTTSSKDIKPEIEDIASTSKHPANLSSSVALTDTGFVGSTKDDREGREETGHCGQKEKERQTREMGPEKQRHLDMSRLEASDQPFASGTTSDATSAPIQRGTEEDSIEAMCVGPLTNPKIVLVEGNYGNTDAASSGHEAAQLQVMKLERRVPQTGQTSHITQTSTMDLDQLKREKIKMQIKVLKLQEEYYTQKLKGQKKFNNFTGV